MHGSYLGGSSSMSWYPYTSLFTNQKTERNIDIIICEVNRLNRIYHINNILNYDIYGVNLYFHHSLTTSRFSHLTGIGDSTNQKVETPICLSSANLIHSAVALHDHFVRSSNHCLRCLCSLSSKSWRWSQQYLNEWIYSLDKIKVSQAGTPRHDNCVRLPVSWKPMNN